MSQPVGYSIPDSRKPFQYGLRWLFVWPLIFAILVGTDGCGLIGFHYPRAVENQPLLSPVRVLSQSGNCWTLADGRSITIAHFDRDDAYVKEALQHGKMLVDLDIDNETREAFVFVNSRGWICGTPYCRLINIPLIPVNVPINRREIIAYGRIGTTVPVALP